MCIMLAEKRPKSRFLTGVLLLQELTIFLRTYVADVDVDPISGRKVINQYEIIDELGRGVHGKVKLGRNLNTEEYVAIKIVDRSARRRRLGKTSNPAEKIKREIAILKKARHPNIVSLLEVIDDPAKKKVYIVLEHVEMGEIRWRAEGAKDICLYEYRYTQRELRGETANSTSSRPETEQKQNIPSDPITSLAQKGEDEPSHEQPFLANSLLDGRELYALKHNTTDYPHGDASPSHQVDNTNGGQRIVPTFGEDKPPSPPANNGTDEEDPSAGSKSNDVCKENSPADIESRNSPHVRSSSRIFDTNATISAANTYNPPAIEDSGIPECFQYVPTMSLPAIREAFRDTVLGLEYLHYQGVIHRDIKPANLLQTREHRVKISDFGVSFLGRQLRENDNDDTTESEAQDFDEGVELAKTVGTPAFFAPELCQTDFDVEPPPVTGQIDVWALGVTLYCLVFGRVPFFHVDTFALMRTIAQDEVYIPRKRLRAVDEINLTHQASFDSRHNSDAAQPISDESIHEAIDGDLYDLIKRLLVKDARKRITLAEVKRHPWILQDVGDPVLWVDQTDPSHQTQGKKIEVSKEDVADAVVPLNIIERVKLEFKRIGGALGLGRSSSRRKRAGSSSVVTDPISFISDMGMLPGGSNRRATEASLGTTTNSKSGHADKRERVYVQDAREASKGSTAREVANKEDYFATAKSLARPSIVEQANDRRISMPAVPIRQRSSVLASNNTRPPPLSDSVKHDGFGSLPAPHEPFNLSGVPEGNSTRSNVIGEPGRRFLRSVRSRERRSHSRLRQGDGQKRSKQELQDQSEHQRAEPSVAFSNTYAEGHVDAVPARRKGSFPAGGSQGSASPRPLSFTLTEQYSSAGGNLSVSRKSSGSSQLSPQKSTDFAVAESPRQRSCFGPSTRRKLSSDKYQQAQDEMIRKMVLEQARFKDAHTSTGRQQKQWTDASFMACPPSPDDNSYGVDHDQAYGQPNAQTSNPNSYASRWHNQYITPSSSDDQFASGVSQSTSNPSIPSVASASSSIIPEEDCKCGRKQTVVRRSSGDTLKTRPRSARIRYSKGGYASGKEPAETDADYHVDADADNDNDTADGNDDDDDDDDDDDNDFIEMSRRRSTGLGQQLGHVYRSKSTAYTKPARRRFPRRSVDDGS